METLAGPIWTVASKLLNQTAAPGSALTIYELLQDLCKNDQTQRDSFLASLSPSQLTSLQIIEEWWRCDIEDEPWFITNTDKTQHIMLLQNFSIVEQALAPVVQLLYGLKPPYPRISTYRLQVHRLFQMEFDPHYNEGEEASYLPFLQECREDSAFYASVQRTIFAFSSAQRLTMSVGVPVFHIEVESNVVSTANKLPAKRIPACVEACPWLGFRKSKQGLPYYLWDSELCKTVVVHEMDIEPAYVCISHTWGRWEDKTKRSIEIPGVEWLVPQNTLYDVEELPTRLKGAQLGRYIWLDLLCIPQDRSALALKEIARQSGIFGNASHVLCWLNTIDGWEGLITAVECMVSLCITGIDSNNSGEHIFDLDIPTGLVLPDNTKQAEEKSTPVGWLTSLWTLQEGCLRPDMLICNKNFELLSYASHAIGLDDLVALHNYTFGLYNPGPYETISNRHQMSEPFTKGTAMQHSQLNPPESGRSRSIVSFLTTEAGALVEVYDAIAMTGMTDLLKFSPTAILYLGQHRQCESSRVEAIMSVMGATKWYSKYLNEEGKAPPAVDLVLDIYPLPFVQEAYGNFGAPFFFASSADLDFLRPLVDHDNGGWDLTGTLVEVGSLMPFRNDKSNMSIPHHRASRRRDHPSVSSWQISHGGVVKMPCAGVVSSGAEEHDSSLPARIYVSGLGDTVEEPETDLHLWTKTFRTDTSALNLAVSLFQSGRHTHCGLLLKQVGQQQFVKIGIFIVAELDIDSVATTNVNWSVL